MMDAPEIAQMSGCNIFTGISNCLVLQLISVIILIMEL